MVLLLLGDSQCERIWPSVRLDRELLRDAIFFPVKNLAAVPSGFQSITASVCLSLCALSKIITQFITQQCVLFIYFMHLLVLCLLGYHRLLRSKSGFNSNFIFRSTLSSFPTWQTSLSIASTRTPMRAHLISCSSSYLHRMGGFLIFVSLSHMLGCSWRPQTLGLDLIGIPSFALL